MGDPLGTSMADTAQRVVAPFRPIIRVRDNRILPRSGIDHSPRQGC
jgi:hypothetical protein